MEDALEYVFHITWYDELGGVDRPYTLTLFIHPSGLKLTEVSIYDVSKKRMFLRKGQYDLRLEDLFVNATVVVYARQFKVVRYGNELTKNAFESSRQVVSVLLPPSLTSEWGNLVAAVERGEFTLTNMKTTLEPQAGQVSLAVEFFGKLGTAQSEEEIRERLFRGVGVDCDKIKVSLGQLSSDMQSTATFDSCSLLVIKPHAVKDGVTGEILARILKANFEISAVARYSLTRQEAEDFLEVYKGVIDTSDFAANSLEFSSGPLIAMEVRAVNAVTELRKLVGPSDMEVAKELRKDTIRACFGKDNAKNAVHCTDLVEDGQLESAFFFDILANQSSSKK